jgi:hypothetical protein
MTHGSTALYWKITWKAPKMAARCSRRGLSSRYERGNPKTLDKCDVLEERIEPRALTFKT